MEVCAVRQKITVSGDIFEKFETGEAEIICLAAYFIMIKRYTGQEHFKIDIDIPLSRKGLLLSTQDLEPEKKIAELISNIRSRLESLSQLPPDDTETFYASFSIKIIPSNNPFLQTVNPSNQPKILLQLIRNGNMLEGWLEFNSDTFDTELAQNMEAHFTELLKEITIQPEKELRQLPALPEKEWKKVITEWNATEENFPEGDCLHQLIEKQVQKTPESIALVYNNKELTYRELNERANFLAQHLIAQGINPEDRVGVLYELSHEAVIAILAILKAGAAFIALDPVLPAKRIQYLINDSAINLLITSSQYQHLSNFDTEKTILTDTTFFKESTTSENPVNQVNPTNLAYLMYTSGSTGEPKGVMIQHDQVVNNMFIVRKRYALSENDTVVSMTSLSFDASVAKLFPALTIGGRVILPTEETGKDVHKIIELIQTYKPVFYPATPAVLRLMNSLDADISCMRMITTGGEALKYSDINNIIHQIPVLNVYGPTEATVSSTSFLLPSRTPDPEKRIPIGKPNPNCQIYILDSTLNPVPIGVNGTLYIGGKGVTRGYWKNPELTAEKFIQNPFTPEERLYNTGDIARWLPDGNLDFIGRNDGQIKIRSYRIEIGEVEHILLNCPFLINAKILVQQDRSGNNFMIACIAPKNPDTLDLKKIKEYLAEHLPTPLIPSEFFVLDKLPLNRSNKIDSQLLLELYLKKPKTKDKIPVFKTGIQQEIATFWKEQFEREIFPSDNFFLAGGHSLHAMQLKLLIKNKFKLDLPVRTIFEHPTIESLTSEVERNIESSGRQKIVSDKNSEDQEISIIAPQKRAYKTRVSNRRPLSQRVSYNLKKHTSWLFAGETSYLPLSSYEERIWFLYRFQMEKTIYNVVKVFHLSGKPDTEALETSFNLLIKRHTNLRKIFEERDGEPRARLLNHLRFKIRKESVEGTTSPQELSKVLIEEEANKAFDLSRDLPIRVTLISKNDSSYLLVICTHHIISDAWSFSILLKELNLQYSAKQSKKTLQLPSLEKEYLYYPALLKKNIRGEQRERLLHYWKNKLKGRIEKLRLPYKRNVDEDISDLAGSEEIFLNESLRFQILDFCKEHHCTLFQFFFSSFQTLLFKFIGQEFIHTGIPIADRQVPETKNLIGFFVNTLILISDFSEDPNFLTVLKNARGEILDSFEHQSLPYDILSNELRKDSGIAPKDLVQVLFDFQHQQKMPDHLGDLGLEEHPLSTRFSKFDLTLSIAEKENRFLIFTEYKKELFESATIQRLLKSFIKLLETVIENPDIKVSRIDLIAPDEKEKILKQWNNTSRAIPETSVSALFEQQVRYTPQSVAIYWNDQSYTYDQLNRKANQLAHYLLKKRFKTEELIGILMEESVESIIAMLAILKSGAAYVPLDPSYPKERLSYMIKTCQVKRLLTKQAFTDFFSDLSLEEVIPEQISSEIENEEDTDPGISVPISSLAYVMFTSGSTGQPKAVGVEHRGIVRLVKNTDYTDMDECSRLLKTGAFSFDASTFEIWGMLLNGGKLFIYPKHSLLDPAFLKDRIRQDKITHGWFTASWFHQLADIDPNIFRPLKTLLAGGDRLSAKHINKVRKAAPGLEIINCYGPTENTTFSTTFKIESEQEDPIPIGKPIPNSTLYILDKVGNVAPVGVWGEIYVGGAGIARGYLNDAVRTRERFIPDPFQPGQKLYKTGDLGRWLENGLVEFGGRNDNQLKIRGFRVEPGEIEAAMTEHARIEEAVILTKEFGGEKQLVGFYKGPEELSFNDLHTFLRKTLTEVMIPIQLTWLEKLPLTPNGKTDRKALAATKIKAPKNKQKELPSNPTEEKLLAVFTEILNTTHFGVSDNFFHAGGHSLMATKLMARIHKHFGKTLPLSLLFQAPTVKELAAIIAGTEFNSIGLIPIQPQGNRTPIFLLPGYLFYYNLSKHLGKNQPLYGFEPISKFKTEEIAATYIKQIKKIQPKGPYFIGGYCASGILAYEMARQLLDNGDELGWLALFEVYTPEATVSKASVQYLSDKMAYWKAGFKASSLKGKCSLLYKEGKKLFNYFFKNTFRKILNDYKIKPFEGHMILFKARDGMVGSANDPYMGWSKYCRTDQITTVEIPGNHSTIFKEPDVKIIAEKLTDYMNRI